MREAVIVSYARTGLAKSRPRRVQHHPDGLHGRPCHEARRGKRAGIETEAVEDCFMGNVAHGAGNLGRNAALLAGLPITTSGVDRQPLLLLGPADHRHGGPLCRSTTAPQIVVGGGVELDQLPGRRRRRQ